MPFIMALDQGTSSSRAIIFDESGVVAGQAQATFDMSFPADGWVEQDPETLWGTTLETGRRALRDAGLEASAITAIGITNQRETTLVWDRATGECVYPAIVWQDRRTESICARIRADGMAATLTDLSGLVVDPYFSATKLAWILNEVEGVRARAERGELCFGTVDTYLMWRLTGGGSHVTDATNAARTQLYDIHNGCWSEAAIQYFAIPASLLPRVADSAGEFGVADKQWFGAAIPILGVAGDQQAALVGQGCIHQGMSKSTYGTGCFVMTNTGTQAVVSTQNLLTTVAYQIGGVATYALEGSIFVAGVGVKWLRDQLGLIGSAADTEAACERTGGNTGGVYVVPAFTGLGAPHWVPTARGLITGLSLDTNRDQLVTAMLLSVGFQTQELLQAMASDGAPVSRLRVDGGMVVNSWLCQFLADINNLPVERPINTETTAYGAAVLAGIGAGIWADLAAAGRSWRLDREFTPDIEPDYRRKLLAGWQHAVATTKGAAQLLEETLEETGVGA